jgi:ribose-phosphate pyrophosphokinase
MLESVIISLDGREDLLKEVSKHLKKRDVTKEIKIDTVNSQKFSDGELCVDFEHSIRGKRVYLLTSPNNSDEIIKLNLAIDAAKRAAAKEIIPIIPYFPYARQDKKDQSRGPIGAKVMVEMIEQRGSTGVITFDLHADQIQGFFNIPVTHLEGKNVFDEYIAKIYDEDTILCGPDAGSGKRVKRMKDQLKQYHDISINYVMLDKTRSQANVVDEMVIIGDVKGKNVIILDDMVDTAGTLCKAAEVIMEAGAKSVRALISHGICSGPALGRIENSVLTELVISDSLPKPIDYNGIYSNNKIKVVSLAKQISLAVAAINSQSSYEGLKKERF